MNLTLVKITGPLMSSAGTTTTIMSSEAAIGMCLAQIMNNFRLNEKKNRETAWIETKYRQAKVRLNEEKHNRWKVALLQISR